MFSRPRWGLVTLLVGLACTSVPDGGDEPGDGEGKEDRGETRTFHEVDRAHSSAAFRRYVDRALVLLEEDGSDLARLTLAAIRDGRVKIDELADLTCWDFERARQDLSATELEPGDWLGLRDPASPALAALTAELDGYMWSNRIYVSRGQPARRLAATLVHEVNHVLNRSEVGYYDDLPTSAFLHEVRAFHAERLFDPDAYEGVDLVAYVIDAYELDRALIPDEILADPITPRLLPDAAAWRARHVEDDPVDVEEECPAFD